MQPNSKKQKTKNKKLTIGWLYPELMSTYGDRGNIIVLSKRCQWREIDVEVLPLDVGFDQKQLAGCQLLFMGGAQDTQQKIVSNDLTKDKVKVLAEMIEDGTAGAYVCGAYQFLGKYYKEADGTVIDGLSIFDLYTESPGGNAERLIGNIVVDTTNSFWQMANNKEAKSQQQIANSQIVGFENHGGRTYLGSNIKPLGTVKVGFGNNGKDGTEGAVYKNSIGTYLHGPILPKNPFLADWLIQKALEKKYKTEIELEKLDDTLELQAHDTIIKRLMKRQ